MLYQTISIIIFDSRIILLLMCFVNFYACKPSPPAHITDLGHLTYLGFTNSDVQCSRCHGDKGTGGMFGPIIRDIVQQKGKLYVTKTIIDGKGIGDARMPAFKGILTSEQIDQIVLFVATLKDSN